MKKIGYSLVAVFLLTLCAFGADEFVPKETTLPEGIRSIVQWLLQSRVFKLGSVTAVVIATVQCLKVVAPIVGSRLTGKAAFIMTAVISLLASVSGVVSDGQIAGDDWVYLVESLMILAAATLGYRLTFSTIAKNDGIVAAFRALVASRPE